MLAVPGFLKQMFSGEKSQQGFAVQCGFHTDQGRVRELNEDFLLVRKAETESLLRRRGFLAVLADGMGGYAAGEVASRLACETIGARYFVESGSVEKALRTAIEAANAAIFAAANQDSTKSSMGTTCVAVAIIGSQAFVGWVGDSRLYLVRDRCIYQLSEDHTIVHEMVKQGLLESSQATVHPERYVLSRALGTKPEVSISIAERPVEMLSGDRLILCSDGLHDLVDDNDVLRTIEGKDCSAAAKLLVDLANERGGGDNITAIIVDVGDPFSTTQAPCKPRDTREIVTR